MNVMWDKALGCLLAGLIGDAMGRPTEGKEPEEIAAQFGWVSDFEGDGTDDSIMKHILADALIKTGGFATIDDWASECLAQRDLIRSKQNRFFISVQHTVRKLQAGYLPKAASIGNMASSSSAMCIAPVGIVNAGHPRAAAAQAEELASLLHSGDVAFCQDAAAAVAAAVASAFLPGATPESVVNDAVRYLKPTSGREMIRLIGDAAELARRSPDYERFRRDYHARFRQSSPIDSRETVPAALALTLLANGDPKDAVIYGANFGRDTDTIATMAGAICGALRGASSLPPQWVEKVQAASGRDQTLLAKRLIETAVTKAETELNAWQAARRVHFAPSIGEGGVL